jgi:hypothetical protein
LSRCPQHYCSLSPPIQSPSTQLHSSSNATCTFWTCAIGCWPPTTTVRSSAGFGAIYCLCLLLWVAAASTPTTGSLRCMTPSDF